MMSQSQGDSQGPAGPRSQIPGHAQSQAGQFYRTDPSLAVNTGGGINASTSSGPEGVSLQQQQDFVNAVISVLEVPKDYTSVAACYANDKNTASEVQAYAKIAGSDWTYYLKDIVITIGRNTSPTDHSVDIDLGPAKVVSRQHATIKFNSATAVWELHVTGRNGAKVNFHRVSSGPNSTPHPLTSGSILDIGGTQMMFILPDQGPYIDANAVAHLTPKLFMAYYNVTTNPLLRNLFQANPDLIHSLEPSSPSHQNSLGPNAHHPHMIVQQGQSQPSARSFKMYDAPDQSMRSQGLSAPMGQMYGQGDGMNGNILPQSSNGTTELTNGQLYGTIANTGFNITTADASTDLSRDENRNIKPPHSYATMITQAILSTEEGELSLSDIYKHISSNYSYYRYTKAGWQNSIRHNLSLNKAFEKVPRKPGEPGKGMKWRISEETQRDFLDKWQSGRIGKARRGSSVTRQLQAHMARFNSLPIQRDNFRFNEQRQGAIKSGSADYSDLNQTPKLEKTAPSLPSGSQSPLRQTSPLVQSQQSVTTYSQHENDSSNFASQHSGQADLPLPKRQHLNPPVQQSSNPQQHLQQEQQQPQQLVQQQSQHLNLPPPSGVQTRGSNAQHIPSNVSSSGSLLHSPNKHFQVNAVEAFTPERGSNLQKSPQPLMHLHSLPQTNELSQGATRLEPGNLTLPPKSSPGVMNLLQFSSVNNTPSTNTNRTPSHATDGVDSKDTKGNMLAISDAFKQPNPMNNNGNTSDLLPSKRLHDDNDDDADRIMSSPIKVNDNRSSHLVVDSNDNKVVVKND